MWNFSVELTLTSSLSLSLFRVRARGTKHVNFFASEHFHFKDTHTRIRDCIQEWNMLFSEINLISECNQA